MLFLLRQRIIFALALFFIAIVPQIGAARDLHGRLGLGYNAEFANSNMAGGVPGISLKYGLSRDFGFELIAGVSTANPTNSVTGVKLLKNLFMETDLNFYFTLGGALVSGGGTSGAQFLGGFGAEFFIPGLESLGFSMETGVGMHNLGGSFVVQTIGVSFVNAGIHFYL